MGIGYVLMCTLLSPRIRGSVDQYCMHDECGVVRAKNDLKNQNTSLDEKLDKLKRIAPTKCLPSIVLHTRNERSENRQTQRRTHNKKLSDLSEKQERPLFNVDLHKFIVNLGSVHFSYNFVHISAE